MLLGAALLSTSAVFVKWVEIGPTASAFWRMALGALFLLPVLLSPRLRGARRPSVRLLALLAVAAACFALDLWLWHRSILYVGVGLSTLLANFQVFALAAYGAFVLAEHTGWRLWSGLLLALAGLWLLLGPDWQSFDAAYRTGIALGLGTALAYAGYLITFRTAQRDRAGFANEAALWWVCVLTALLLLPLALGEGSFLPVGVSDWSALAAYALIAQVLGWLLIGRAMPQLPASIVGLCLLLQPLLAYVWDALLFGTVLGWLEMIGLGLSLLGIFLGLTRQAPRAVAVAGDGI